MSSINTNPGAMQALQVLKAASASLSAVQDRVNTGLDVASTRDDSAVYTRAQAVRGDILGLQAVMGGLSRWNSITDVAVNGTEGISDLVIKLKQKAILYQDADPAAREAIRKDMEGMIDQIDQTVDSSEFSGVNLLKGTPITETSTHYLYALPPSSMAPTGFLQKMVSLPPESSTDTAYTRTYSLPPSPLTPPDFDAFPSGNVYPATRTVDGGATAGRVNLMLSTDSSPSGSGVPNAIEIWQNGVRVAASGQPYAADGAEVDAAVPRAGPYVVSFDYDPAKGQDLEIRIDPGAPSNVVNPYMVDLQLQDPAEPIPDPIPAWNFGTGPVVTAQFDPPRDAANPEEVVRALDDPLWERWLPVGNSATYTANGGPRAGRVDMTFDAYDLPDTMEVWQNGVRIAATGQDYAPGGGAVDAGVPVSGLNLISFDYDPAAGPVTFTFNGGEGGTADPMSAWAVGGVSLQALDAPRVSLADSHFSMTGSTRNAFGPVRYNPLVDIKGDTARITSHDLRASSLGIDPMDWDNPGHMLDMLEGAEGKVSDVLSYFGAQSRAFDGRIATASALLDASQAGLGNIVDADLGKESARLQAEQIRVQLATQSLAIANRAPQLLLQLFNTG